MVENSKRSGTNSRTACLLLYLDDQTLTSTIRWDRWLNRFPVSNRLKVFVQRIVTLFFPVFIHEV